MQTSSATHCAVVKAENLQLDWSLPLSYTIYCVQRATEEDPRQLVTVEVNNGLHVGSVVTEWTPALTLNAANVVGGGRVRPGAVSFSGTAPAGAEITLYDNGTLCAVTAADAYGRYGGLVQLVSGAAARRPWSGCGISSANTATI